MKIGPVKLNTAFQPPKLSFFWRGFAVATDNINQESINNEEWSNPENWGGPDWMAVYFSKKDSRTWVPKKIPAMGWTINLAQASGVTGSLDF